MPVKGPKPNTWFSGTISKLPGIHIDNGAVLLNASNAAIIEAHIGNNQSYNAKFTEKMLEYYRLKNGRACPRTGSDAKGPILDLIRMIDLENSTNQWRYKGNRPYVMAMVDYITDPSTGFWNRLDQGDIKLPDVLLASCAASSTSGPRSLASKVCRYFSELFLGKDNYYINDSVVRHVLPYYLNYYGISIPKGQNTMNYFKALKYDDLHIWLGKLRAQTSPQLKRSELDHIMWYCYRYEA